MRRAEERLGMQAAAYAVWDLRYRAKRADGAAIDRTVDDMWTRVARCVAGGEATVALRAEWTERFLACLRAGAVPAGRILANAGLPAGPARTLVNCTVGATLRDAEPALRAALGEAAVTLGAGAGIGHDFSSLAPAGAGTGPLAMLARFEALCPDLLAGRRRGGAQMGCLDIRHPDIAAFIDAKRDPEALPHFNLSVLVDAEFLAALRGEGDWALRYPIDGGRVHRVVPARALLDALADAAYDTGDPGFLRIDLHNEANNLWFAEQIRATNPCGEQGLPPHGACLLGSVDLTRFVTAPFTASAAFDWSRFRSTVQVFTRFLDNIVEMNGLPVAAQRESLLRTRRHGMGYLGLGSALAMLGLHYASPMARNFAARVTRALMHEGWRVALALAEEKGPAPILGQDWTVTAQHLVARPALAAAGVRAGDRVAGRILHAHHARALAWLREEDPVLMARLAEIGARFSHHAAIAPTGTIALALADNASSGIEPTWAQCHERRLQGAPGQAPIELVLGSREWRAWRAWLRSQGYPADDLDAAPLPPSFVSALEVAPEDHLAMQAAVQQHVDGAIAKTINVPAALPRTAFRRLYAEALGSGVKGAAFFRVGSQRPSVLGAAHGPCALR